MEQLLKDVLRQAEDFAATAGVDAAVLAYGERQFVPQAPARFCARCPVAAAGKCHWQNTHLYGSFEAERWNGLYIYYCPASLAFTATTVYQGKASRFAIISGPVVMSAPQDVLEADNSGMDALLHTLPARSPAQTTALANTQWAIAMFLSRRDAAQARENAQSQTKLMNALYDMSDKLHEGGSGRYPVEIEQRLQRMITQGDRQGAQELINQLLGHMYFAVPGDFAEIKQRAQELVVLFSRASIEGGADVRQIFGQSRDVMQEIAHCKSLDELSGLLTAIFYRFVGYVFDFTQIEHTDTVFKAINYVREHYGQKITLDDVAAHVFLSKSYLSKIFKEELGSSFTDYVNSVRVEKSRELLLDDTISLAEIADAVGFSDQSYFTKVFSGLVGVSPGQYRKSRGKAK